MRISGISVLPLLALPLAVLGHDAQAAGHNVGRHNEAEYMRRQLLGIIGGDDDTTSSSAAATSSRASSTISTPGLTLVPPASSSAAASSTSAPASSAISTATSSGASSSGSLSSSSSISSSANTSIPIPSTAAAPSSSAQSVSASVDAQGQTVIVTLYATASAPPTSSAPAQTSAAASSEGSGISTPAIVGISIAAGVVVLGLIGCAVWRMKRRSTDEDEAIRWPELNRHGDSDAHHALPARQTGQHGIETSPLERSLSNSSSVFASSLSRGPSTHMTSTAMALNGSNFGAANSLDYYDEKNAYPPAAAYDAYDTNYGLPNPHGPPEEMYGHGAPMMDDYSSMPPPMQHAHASHGAHTPGYASSDEGDMAGGGAGAAGVGARHGAYRS